MTTPTHPSLAHDISFLKTLAQAGENTPLTCGPFLAAAGLVFAVASGMAWASTQAFFGLTEQAIPWIFATAMAIYLCFIVVFCSLVQQTGAASFSNRALKWVWSSLGSCIGAVFISALMLNYKLNTPLVWVLFPSLVLGLYGSAWLVTAYISNQDWLKAIAAGSFVGALLVAAFCDSSATLLVYGGLMLLLVALPGIILMRKHASAP